MVNPSQLSQGAAKTLQSLVHDALVLLKLVEEKMTMDKDTLEPKFKKAQDSVEDLLGALQNTDKLAVNIYKSEINKIEEEVKAIDWTKYQDPQEPQ